MAPLLLALASCGGGGGSQAVVVPPPVIIGPTANSVTAATSTAKSNALCATIAPFYWEIGDQSGSLASGSIGTTSSGTMITGATQVSIASGSKWVYGMYVVELRGSAAGLTAADIPFMNFTSGYTNIGNDPKTAKCPASNSPDTVNACLTTLNPATNLPYSTQDPNTTGKFDYDSGHFENHASQLGSLGDVPLVSLGSTVAAQLGGGVDLQYTQPMMAFAVYTNSDQYAELLRRVLDGSLKMHDALGTHAVCTLPSASCNAVQSPIPEAWHYSIGHWVEDDSSTHGDGAFSSAGALGFYPWIDAAKKYYGVISREDVAALASGQQAGYASAQCGRLIRHAWETGVAQTGTIPD